jgi:hypothetical protein
MKFLVRYWAQITGFVIAAAAVFGWLWNLKTRLDTYLNTQQQLVAWQQTAQAELSAHDEELDDHSDKLIVLNKIEDLRERGLMK